MGFLYHFCAGCLIIFVAEEWVKDARNEARAEANHSVEVTKLLGDLEVGK